MKCEVLNMENKLFILFWLMYLLFYVSKLYNKNIIYKLLLSIDVILLILIIYLFLK